MHDLVRFKLHGLKHYFQATGMLSRPSSPSGMVKGLPVSHKKPSEENWAPKPVILIPEGVKEVEKNARVSGFRGLRGPSGKKRMITHANS